MKQVKTNNKGFSLVELIVVVLIMGILAVALTPQVLKWVNNSRISADNDTKNAVVAAVNTALTNEDVYANVMAATGAKKYYIAVGTNGWAINVDTAVTVSATDGKVTGAKKIDGTESDAFIKKFLEYSGATGKTDETVGTGFKVKQSKTYFTVTVEQNASTKTPKVTVTAGTNFKSEVED